MVSHVGTLWHVPEHDEWLTVEEVMKYLKVGRSTVYRWMREDRLPWRELTSGGGRRFRRSDVEKLLEEPRRPS
jgi:excisionase family DNA binding protein